MDEIQIGDKTYISTKRAAKITGYAKDYVGQLCREGRVAARLVGRNWYVLEESIREHRFGKKEEPEEKEEATPVVGATWAAPTYKAEVPRLVPELTPKSAGVGQAPAIAEMQSAWQEWFESRPQGSTVTVQQYQEQIIEVTEAPQTPETAELSDIEEQQEEVAAEEGTSVSVARIHSEEAPAAPRPLAPVDMMPIRRPQSSFTGLEGSTRSRTVTPPLVQRSVSILEEETEPVRGMGVVYVLLFVLAGASVLVALIGTGYGSRFFGSTSVDFGFQKPLMEFLEGSRTYENSL